MPDEIDLLRRFREDTPEPDDAAWNRARTALADARADESGVPGTPGRRHRRCEPERLRDAPDGRFRKRRKRRGTPGR